MYQLAKDLVKEFDGDILTKEDITYDTSLFDFKSGTIEGVLLQMLLQKQSAERKYNE